MLLVRLNALFCRVSLTKFRTGAGGAPATTLVPTTTTAAGGGSGGATPTGLTTTLPKSSGAGV